MKNCEHSSVPTLLLILFIFSFSWSQEINSSENSVAISANDPNLDWGPCPEFMPEGCNIAVLHGDPTKKNVDVFLKVPANSTIPKHTHTSAERMILVAGEMEVTYEGEEPQKLETGSYAYGPAKKPHNAKCGNSPCILFIAFEEPLDANPLLAKN